MPEFKELEPEECCRSESPESYSCTIPKKDKHRRCEAWSQWGMWSGNHPDRRPLSSWPNPNPETRPYNDEPWPNDHDLLPFATKEELGRLEPAYDEEGRPNYPAPRHPGGEAAEEGRAGGEDGSEVHRS